MKKFILAVSLLSSLYVYADIIIHGGQKTGKGGNSVLGSGGKSGDINNTSHKDQNTSKNTNVNTSASIIKKMLIDYNTLK